MGSPVLRLLAEIPWHPLRPVIHALLIPLCLAQLALAILAIRSPVHRALFLTLTIVQRLALLLGGGAIPIPLAFLIRTLFVTVLRLRVPRTVLGVCWSFAARLRWGLLLIEWFTVRPLTPAESRPLAMVTVAPPRLLALAIPPLLLTVSLRLRLARLGTLLVPSMV